MVPARFAVDFGKLTNWASDIVPKMIQWSSGIATIIPSEVICKSYDSKLPESSASASSPCAARNEPFSMASVFSSSRATQNVKSAVLAAQRLDFAWQRNRQFMEHGFNRPAFLAEAGHCNGTGLGYRQVRQNVQFGVAITGDGSYNCTVKRLTARSRPTNVSRTRYSQAFSPRLVLPAICGYSRGFPIHCPCRRITNRARLARRPNRKPGVQKFRLAIHRSCRSTVADMSGNSERSWACPSSARKTSRTNRVA